MSRPLYEAKAELFRTLGHPVRVRILELLLAGPRPVRDLLADLELEPSNLSQQLAVLRRARLVTSTRDGASVTYALSAPNVAELMLAARELLTSVILGQEELLADLQTELGAR
ncbi:transcriptional regulator [Luteimicrobium album]|uniref:Transcriptional regulator n=1 Tax=Luteimicrobium album TaxID=1054550 RepID=A0ABQ6I324_9MICO|nr:metalloregulator ArsR/SmtB family transcription factor [Luteimicrobium album]GMA25071.1 transcriptional regulator [Luteimicrobium album]